MSLESVICAVPGCGKNATPQPAPLCRECWALVPHQTREALRGFYKMAAWAQHTEALKRTIKIVQTLRAREDAAPKQQGLL